MSVRICRVAGCVLIALAAVLAAQQKKALTNQDIVTMVKGGFPDNLILLAIQANSCEFDTSVDGLIALKKQNVSETIIREMLAVEAKKHGRPSSAAARSAAPVAGAPSPIPPTGSATSAPGNSTSAFPSFPVDFSAEQFTISGADPPVSLGKLFVSKGRLRFAAQSPALTTIVDPPKLTGYLVAPGKAAEVVTRFEGVRGVVNQGGLSKFLLPVDPDTPCAYWLDVDCKRLGTETVDGWTTTKWEVTHTPQGATWITYMWVDVRLHIVSRTQYQDSITELRNIVEGAQPLGLFEVP